MMIKARGISPDPQYTPRKISRFHEIIHSFYAQNKREFPWRENITPYRIVVSEIMLQQTGVERVRRKYDTFLARFPGFEDLARASVKDVVEQWQGLGYNRRALSLKKMSSVIMENYSGNLPDIPDELVKLPGIGKATAGAVCAFAFNKPVIFIETNIRRVFIHHFFEGLSEISDKQMVPIVEATLDRKNPRDWYYALMDYGTYLATRSGNPNRRSAHYSKQSPFHDSDRKIRGELVRFFLRHGPSRMEDIVREVGVDTQRLGRIVQSMVADGLLTLRDGAYDIS